MATEAGNLAADASIQALGGYGYTHEYMVEKIKRDVRITTIYEGTSEIMEMTIARDRWQLHLKTRGQYYHDQAQKLEALHTSHSDVGAGIAALALHGVAEVMEKARIARLTRYQHILLRIGELIAYAECAGSLARRAAALKENKLNEKANRRFDVIALARVSRIFAREAALKVGEEGVRWVVGAGGVSDADLPAFENSLGLPAIHQAQAELISDMDYVADVLYGRAAKRGAGSVGRRKRRTSRALLLNASSLSFIERPHHGKHFPSSHRDCRSRSHPARRAQRVDFLGEREERPLQHH